MSYVELRQADGDGYSVTYAGWDATFDVRPNRVTGAIEFWIDTRDSDCSIANVRMTRMEALALLRAISEAIERG